MNTRAVGTLVAIENAFAQLRPIPRDVLIHAAVRLTFEIPRCVDTMDDAGDA